MAEKRVMSNDDTFWSYSFEELLSRLWLEPNEEIVSASMSGQSLQLITRKPMNVEQHVTIDVETGAETPIPPP